ncbi:MAG: hypothetical protein WD801_13460 [Gemmatimonadaceae bacterium]
MSLIIDATNAAQREKERRAASSAAVPPMLVPLRSQPAREFNWQRALMIGIGGAVLLGAGWVVFVKMQDVRRQPMALVSPPLISDVAAGLPAIDSSAQVLRDVASRPAQTRPSARTTTAPVRPAPGGRAVRSSGGAAGCRWPCARQRRSATAGRRAGAASPACGEPWASQHRGGCARGESLADIRRGSRGASRG